MTKETMMNIPQKIENAVLEVARRRAPAPTPTASAPRGLEACIEELVKNAAAADAKNVTVTLGASELRVVDDGAGIRRFGTFLGDGEGLRRSVLALCALPILRVTSTNLHEKNNATIDVRNSSVINGGRSPARTLPTGSTGFFPARSLARGTDITITERSLGSSLLSAGSTPASWKLTENVADLESRLRGLHPGVAITVTVQG